MNGFARKTGKLTDSHQIRLGDESKPLEPRLGRLRPWRLAFVLKDAGVRIVSDVTEALILGRISPDGSDIPVIDLRPFDADDSGVSRKHLMIRVENDGVYATDLQSANGTFINGKRMDPNTSYPIYHHDVLVIGLMQIVIELLIDPLS